MTSPLPDDRRLIEAVIRVECIGSDIGEIKVSIKEMAGAITRLAIFEERQTHDRIELGRVTRSVEQHEGRLSTIELAQPLQKQTTDWAATLAKLVIGAVITAVLATVVVSRFPDAAGRIAGKAAQQESR